MKVKQNRTIVLKINSEFYKGQRLNKTKQNMKESQSGPQMEVGLPIVPRTAAELSH